jgi:hypothetical protein
VTAAQGRGTTGTQLARQLYDLTHTSWDRSDGEQGCFNSNSLPIPSFRLKHIVPFYLALFKKFHRPIEVAIPFKPLGLGLSVHYQATEIAKLEFHHNCIRANVPLAGYAVKELSKNLFKKWCHRSG